MRLGKMLERQGTGFPPDERRKRDAHAGAAALMAALLRRSITLASAC